MASPPRGETPDDDELLDRLVAERDPDPKGLEKERIRPVPPVPRPMARKRRKQ